MKKLFATLTIISLFTIFSACKDIKVDNELMDSIKTCAAKCKIDLKYAFVKDCPEVMTLKNLARKKPLPFALGTASKALNDSDEKIRAVACKLLYGELKSRISLIKKNPDSISKDVVKNLISGTENIKTYIAFYATAATTHLAMIKGAEDDLYEMITEHPIRQVRYEAYSNLMTYGRLKAFEKIKEIVATKTKDRWLRVNAIKAPSRMYQYTDKESTIIGDWATPLLKSEDANIAFYAGAALNRCRGKYIDVMLDECENRAKENKLKPPFSNILTNFSFSCKPMFGSKPTGTPEQCARKERLKKLIKK